MFRPKTATVECPHCGTEFTGVPVDHDEDGEPCTEIDAEQCHDYGCAVKLCRCCPQFSCDGCGHKHCLEHKTRVEDLDLCPTCAEEPEPECECVRIDVDLDDASGCLLHGPHSEMARRQLEREAADEAAWAEAMAPVFEEVEQ
jgi:hypothetical protein